MTPAERVMAALRGRPVDHIPFTAYENKITPGRVERELRNGGLCIVQRPPLLYTVSVPNCRIETRCESRPVQSTGATASAGTFIHTRIETPSGVLTAVDRDRSGENQNAWHVKHLFGDPADYGALEAYLSDLTYDPNYEPVTAKIRSGGGDLFLRGGLGYSPMHALMYTYMGVERFSFEWADNRSRVMDLYEILSEKYRNLCRVAARAPNLAVNICGNVSASVVSPDMFREYYLPRYNEACDILHGGGRLVGVHFDGITMPYAKAIAESGLDYIEALTPPPTCDVSPADAHRMWPDKRIWINFPSSVHLEPEDRIREVARRLLHEADPEKGFLLGITEDVPADRGQISYPIILEEIHRRASR